MSISDTIFKDIFNEIKSAVPFDNVEFEGYARKLGINKKAIISFTSIESIFLDNPTSALDEYFYDSLKIGVSVELSGPKIQIKEEAVRFMFALKNGSHKFISLAGPITSSFSLLGDEKRVIFIETVSFELNCRVKFKNIVNRSDDDIREIEKKIEVKHD